MKNILLLISIISVLYISCNIESSGQYTYKLPEQLSDGIELCAPEKAGIDARYIADAVNEIYKGKYREVHSMLIFKDNKLVVEEYFQGHKYKWDAPYHHGEWVQWDKTMLHDVKSVTKSITSVCIGIAIDKGYIESAHQPIFDYLPNHQHLKVGGKGKITIEHLLTMTSGLEWNEWGSPYSSIGNDIIALWFSCDDQVACILQKPLKHEPGKKFTYSGGNMIILGEILKNASGMNIDEFSMKYLFGPLGIDSTLWIQYGSGIIETAGSLEITSRDMAKIGLTLLNNGKWDGQQIISKQWVEKSATTYKRNTGINIPGVNSGRHGYSYSWWVSEFLNSGKRIAMYNAGGWGGQKIIIIPSLNAVVVFTGGNYTSTVKVHTLLKKYILPAMI